MFFTCETHVFPFEFVALGFIRSFTVDYGIRVYRALRNYKGN